MPEYASINLHPSTHPLSSLTSSTYDVICIGSGWAGRTLAARAVRAGLTALVVEDELVGGDCPFWACVPSKALLRPAEALAAAAAVRGVRSKLAPPLTQPDVSAVLARRDAYTHGWDDGAVTVPLVERSGAALVRGRGEVTGVKSVRVVDGEGGEVRLVARHVVAVCTGSEPVVPDIPGLAAARPWGPRQAVSAGEVPASLVVLGAGPIGAEMATAYSGFGSLVVWVAASGEVLPRMDVEAGRLVRESLEKKGVKVYLSTSATAVQRNADRSVSVTLSNGEVLQAAEILVTVGRSARTKDMGLDKLGLKVDGSPLPVDESMCVRSVPGNWLYALGDVNGRAPLTHSSKYHARVAAAAVIARARGEPVPAAPAAYSRFAATADVEALPQVVFTSPMVASVGLTRAAAQAAGRAVREVTAPFVTLGAMIHAEGFEDGWAQWIVDAETDRLLGATFVGDNAADLLHASTVAVVGGLTLDRLAHAIPPFPTMSEVYLNLIEAAGL